MLKIQSNQRQPVYDLSMLKARNVIFFFHKINYHHFGSSELDIIIWCQLMIKKKVVCKCSTIVPGALHHFWKILTRDKQRTF